MHGGDCLNWQQRAMQLWRDKKSWSEITRIIQTEYFPDETFEVVRDNRVRNYIRRQKEYQNKPVDILKLLHDGTTLTKLAKAVGVSERIAKSIIAETSDKGYNVLLSNGEYKISSVIVPEENHIKCDWHGEKIIRFGLMGDTQINSKYTQITHLHALYDIYAAEGIDTVYHTGDMDEGEEMRPGHKYECYTQGADNHVDEIVRVYPERTGITTHFITGNHDHSLIKRAGMDIGKPVAEKRPDMKYLGQSCAIISLTDNCTLELRHPIDGTAYAISYKMQKMIEAMSGGEKPNILAVGHYHKAEYIMYRNVHAIQTGCFQAQTPFMRGKGIAAMMGGWIVEIYVHDDGAVKRFKQEFVPFYQAIKDDYFRWQR